ncbi:MAG: GNAT family N-acetyltransferase [Candidatus Levybacteria bacterium]|nr:GNAT family N-acetyltransferase [Candidatus Levybacteria bacterium]
MANEEQAKIINVEIHPLGENDIAQLEPILIQHVRSDAGEILLNEIDDIKRYMKGGQDQYGRTRTYFVAKDETGKVLGCTAYSQPDPDMLRHFNTTPELSIELLNNFVSGEVFRGGGIGRKLFTAVCNEAKKLGKKQLVLNSGPRYKASWGFYDRVCDESYGFLPDKFGKGRHAKTWKKAL